MSHVYIRKKNQLEAMKCLTDLYWLLIACLDWMNESLFIRFVRLSISVKKTLALQSIKPQKIVQIDLLQKFESRKKIDKSFHFSLSSVYSRHSRKHFNGTIGGLKRTVPKTSNKNGKNVKIFQFFFSIWHTNGQKMMPTTTFVHLNGTFEM